MSKRHSSIGIKQSIRLEWMEKTTNLLLAGLDSNSVRQELHDYIVAFRENTARGCVVKEKGSTAERSEQTRIFIVSNLSRIWLTPSSELIGFRDVALTLLQNYPAMALPVHWAMVSAAYPFWFNVARQTGRLLNLQERITQQQIVNRLKEDYGDRPTISRYARYVIRSFVEWGVLVDSQFKGCYEKAAPLRVKNKDVAMLLLESALLADAEGKGVMKSLSNTPSFFPFHLPTITGDHVARQIHRIEVVRYGLDDELLKLK